jgi:phosphotransferase system, enzyme I, PtsP
MSKDNVDLICDIGELAGLFERTHSLSDFLQKVVSIIAYHMKAAVCSVYLFDEKTQELVLSATQGLNPAFVGRVRLKPSEGIVGQALTELRTVREGRGQQNPHFKFIPGLAEDKYNAFMAVPLVRGLSRVGVLAVQDPVPNYFNENDEKAMRAIAAQLASTIQNVNLLMSVRSVTPQLAEAAAGAVFDIKFMKGVAASGGLAYGRAAIMGHLDIHEFANSGAVHTLADFHRALAETERQLQELQKLMAERMADVASLIFDTYVLMLKDAEFAGMMQNKIETGTAPAEAIITVVNQYVNLFAASQNAMLRDKTQDIKDLGHRLLHNLFEKSVGSADYEGHVVISSNLLPSDIVKLVVQHAAGLVIAGGGITSHSTILARSLQLPMTIVRDPRILGVPENTMVLMDADQGNVFINPGPDVIAKYESLKEARHRAEEHESQVQATTSTRDGERVRLLANINLLSDLKVAKRLKAEGVGLYRSELPFIVRNDFPSEEEQYRIYRTLVEQMSGKEVVFRTLDIGGDKMLSYFQNVNEANPFLGLRALRFSLRHKDIFSQQLRAFLRAGAGSRMRIMFPLVSSVDDFILAKEIVAECAQALQAERVAYCTDVDLGVMIELPSAVEIASELAHEADFLCIGSNDLVQYILAVDRTNEEIADLYLPYHPAVLRSLKRIADAAEGEKVDLSLCGDIASDARVIPFLLGIGIRTLSMDSARIPKVQERISELSMTECRETASAMLKMSRISEIEAFLQKRS